MLTRVCALACRPYLLWCRLSRSCRRGSSAKLGVGLSVARLHALCLLSSHWG